MFGDRNGAVLVTVSATASRRSRIGEYGDSVGKVKEGVECECECCTWDACQDIIVSIFE
jgi:hypothetical protein